jgi:hypothetical protein
MAAIAVVMLVGCKPATAAHKGTPTTARPASSASASPTPTPTATTLTSAAPASIPSPPAGPTSRPGHIAPPVLLNVASGELAALAIKGRAPMTGYARTQFGPAWPERNGCDARDIVLRRDLTATTLQGSCTVETGVLLSPYTGGTIRFVRGPNSAIVQIDHVVALGDAWQTGAQTWTAATRENFANDPAELLAVDGPSNDQKGDADAASWLPPNKVFRCAYVAIQINVKATYHLWVTQAEHDAMASVLAGCGATPVAPTTAAAATATTTPTPTPAKPTAPLAPPTPTTPAPTTGVVTPGAFCATAGATGVSKTGSHEVCKSTATDSRLRWRAA